MQNEHAAPTRAQSFLWALVAYMVVRAVLGVVLARLPYPPELVPTGVNPAYAALVEPWNRWDVGYYVKIAEQGYGTDPSTTNFHPLYGWLGRWPALLFGDTVVGLLVVSGLAAVLLFLVLERWARDEGVSLPRWTVAALCVLPSAYVLWAPYSESLFLLMTSLCLWMAHRHRWWLAGGFGFMAGLVRQQGVLLILPIIWEFAAAQGGWREIFKLRALGGWMAASLPGFGYLAAVVTRIVTLGGLPDQWWLPQNWIYSILLSPQAHTVVKGQAIVPPWVGLWRAFQQLSPDASMQFGSVTWIGRWTDVITGALYILILVLVWRRLRVPHRVYCIGVFLLSWSYYTGELYAYMGLSRHLLLAVPLVLPIAEWASTIPPRRVLLVLSAGLILIAQTCLYALMLWVP